MFFGSVPVAQALGGVAVHTIRQGGLVLKKGTTISAGEVAALEAAGIGEIVVARLSPDDVGEDEAAAWLAALVAGPGLKVEAAFTGRANIFAETAGVLLVDKERVDAVNAVNESITLATLPAFAVTREGGMAATVKMIPYAVERRHLEAAFEAAGGPILSLAPFAPLRIATISTRLPGLKESVIDKTLRVLESRLALAQAQIIADRRVDHRPEAIAAALAELRAARPDITIIYGASAIADRRDAIPAAIEAAGGRIEHLGMPVDPGNLMLIGSLDGRPVLGAPGCARSPRENGFDWVLMRLLAGQAVTTLDVTRLGVGGLLMEIPTRPQPRAAPIEAASGPAVAAVVLAAGRSTRMGGPNKLLQSVGGRALVRIAAETALASRASQVVVVTGHQAAEVEAALQGLSVTFVHNPDYAEGLSTSVRTGIAALPASVDAAVICLGDMPRVGAALIDRLIEAFDPSSGALIVLPSHVGQRGNPVLWARRFFEDLKALEGDTGARQILARHGDGIVEVPVTDEGASFDVDTPEALAALAGMRASAD